MVAPYDPDLELRMSWRRHLDVPAVVLGSGRESEQVRIEITGLRHPAHTLFQPAGGCGLEQPLEGRAFGVILGGARGRVA